MMVNGYDILCACVCADFQIMIRTDLYLAKSALHKFVNRDRDSFVWQTAIYMAP